MFRNTLGMNFRNNSSDHFLGNHSRGPSNSVSSPGVSILFGGMPNYGDAMKSIHGVVQPQYVPPSNSYRHEKPVSASKRDPIPSQKPIPTQSTPQQRNFDPSPSQPPVQPASSQPVTQTNPSQPPTQIITKAPTSISKHPLPSASHPKPTHKFFYDQKPIPKAHPAPLSFQSLQQSYSQRAHQAGIYDWLSF